MHLQEIANKLPDAFNDAAKVTKSHVLAMNAPAKINVPVRKGQNTAAKEFAIRHKRGRPINSNDLAPRKMRNEQSSLCPPEEAHNIPEEFPPEEARNALEEIPPEEAHNTPEEVMVKFVLYRIIEVLDETLEAPKETLMPDNEDISILYNCSRENE